MIQIAIFLVIGLGLLGFAVGRARAAAFSKGAFPLPPGRIAAPTTMAPMCCCGPLALPFWSHWWPQR
jgi:hypothetical protein